MTRREYVKPAAQFMASVAEDSGVRLSREQVVELVEHNRALKAQAGMEWPEAEEILAFARRAGVGQVREWPGITVIRTH